MRKITHKFYASGQPEISEGLSVGGWPSSVGNLPPGEPAVIDCTCELPRSSSVLKNAYLCVATWDTRAPLPSQIESAVRWACRKRAQGKSVFIHCAFVELGLVEDWKSAEKLIKEKRPCIRMNALHRKSLEEWSKNRLSTKRNERTDRPGAGWLVETSRPVRDGYFLVAAPIMTYQTSHL
ncbi:hypothetical protein QJS10_CPA02g00970 [Acorus calamus]|uniref:Uncharacterized protein n=1 Tax=Acorus calamus TaxID=4465 RepID=A0AAV9FHK9_ACOCL|nr:hypothetical protein QJS10_CPA02g00970 [Acorus calamus]